MHCWSPHVKGPGRQRRNGFCQAPSAQLHWSVQQVSQGICSGVQAEPTLGGVHGACASTAGSRCASIAPPVAITPPVPSAQPVAITPPVAPPVAPVVAAPSVLGFLLRIGVEQPATQTRRQPAKRTGRENRQAGGAMSIIRS